VKVAAVDRDALQRFTIEGRAIAARYVNGTGFEA
jgi:hypothetical protein